MTFGCSFTKYHWPTWADIVLKQAELEGFETDNWGMPGSGNLFIAIQIQHAIASGLLKTGDHAFISWSTFAREDRLVDGRWILPGNIFNQQSYSQDWVEKYADVEFYTLRDCALINATQLALKNLGITQTNFNMHWIEPYYSGNDPLAGDTKDNSPTSNVRDRVNKAIDTFNPRFDCKPILEVLGYPPPVTLQVAWSASNLKEVYTDTHHHPVCMLRYVKQEICKLGIPWLTTVRPEVEEWTLAWDHKIKTAPQPLRYTEFPLTMAKSQQWGF